MRAVIAAAKLVTRISPTRVGIDETVMTTGRLTTRRREFLTALVCLETSLVVAVAQGRDRASAARLLADHAPDAEVVACDLFSGFKSAADTLDGAVVVADVFHLVRLALQALDEVRRRRQQQIHGHRGHNHDPLFRLRRVLRVAQERLDESTVERIFHRLRGADTDDEVGSAWVAVDLLRRMYQAPDREDPPPGRGGHGPGAGSGPALAGKSSWLRGTPLSFVDEGGTDPSSEGRCPSVGCSARSVVMSTACRVTATVSARAGPMRRPGLPARSSGSVLRTPTGRRAGGGEPPLLRS
jgi:hypothetical protein